MTAVAFLLPCGQPWRLKPAIRCSAHPSPAYSDTSGSHSHWGDPPPLSFHRCIECFQWKFPHGQVFVLTLPTTLGWEREDLYLLLAAGKGHEGRSKTEVPGGSFVSWILVCLLGRGCSWLAWSPSLPLALTESRICLLPLISACHIDCSRV